jgi:mannose-6-phosphate isomerase-like protein (cupin superfamily)
MKTNIEKDTIRNTYYRKVISTTPTMQLVLMTLPPDTDIGRERHPYTSQFIKVEKGNGTAYIKNKRYNLKDGDSLLIPPNTNHNIVNTSNKPLHLYSIYSPPEHPKDRKEKYKN